MQRVKVSSKGQITIPKAVREKLGLRTGDKVDFYEKDGWFYIRKDSPADPPGNEAVSSREREENPFRKWDGFLGKSDKTPDEIVEEMRGR